jgi:signal transduction histidine kinase
MITLVPRADTFTGRALHRIGHLLGLRSETVYSRTILLVALIQFIVLGFAVVLVWLAVTAQFRQADEQELVSAARRVQSYFASQPSVSPDLLVPRAAELTGRRIYVRPSAPGETQSGIRLVSDRGGVPDAVFFFAGGGAREVVVAGSVSFYEAGLLAARTFVVGLALAGGLMLLVILFVVDRTIVGRIQSLTDKVEHEKSSERLPVRLDYRGDDELGILARSIEELARQVQSAEREYRRVVEDQTESICRFNGDRELTFSNRTFANLCEHAPQGHRPRLADCLDVSTRTLLEDQLAGLGPSSTTAAFTHVVRKGGSAPVWLRSTLRATFAADGSFSGGQWIASDVTTEVRAQRQLQHSERQLQALSARLMNLQDDERRRIARDLHDSTAQNLSALEMNMSVIASLASDDKTRKVADETAAISRQVCQELRNISYLLHPPLLEEEGLAFAIRWFADGFTKRNNIPVFLDLPDDFPRLAEDKETALFRIVQEALSNIYRHAGATKAWITLQRGENGEILLEVRDNGEGLPEGFSFSKSVGVGLAGMRERMKQLGGTLELDSSPYGVSVKCRLGAADKSKELATDRHG